MGRYVSVRGPPNQATIRVQDVRSIGISDRYTREDSNQEMGVRGQERRREGRSLAKSCLPNIGHESLPRSTFFCSDRLLSSIRSDQPTQQVISCTFVRNRFMFTLGGREGLSCQVLLGE